MSYLCTLRRAPGDAPKGIHQERLADTVGPAGVATGIILVALGWILEERSVGIGAAIRTLGGVFFLAGLATVVFGDSRRRAVGTGMSKRIVLRHLSRTVHWGLAGQSGTGRCDYWARTVRSRRGAPDHFPKRCGGRSAGCPALLGWSIPSHLRRFYRGDDARTSHHPPRSCPVQLAEGMTEAALDSDA